MIIELIMQGLSQKKMNQTDFKLKAVTNRKPCYPFILKTSFFPRATITRSYACGPGNAHGHLWRRWKQIFL